MYGKREGDKMSELTKDGVSTTTTSGVFAYEWFITAGRGRLKKVHWDYRDSKGKLHTGIANSIEEAKADASICSGEEVR